jgi:hypothetical protein
VWGKKKSRDKPGSRSTILHDFAGLGLVFVAVALLEAFAGITRVATNPTVLAMICVVPMFRSHVLTSDM